MGRSAKISTQLAIMLDTMCKEVARGLLAILSFPVSDVLAHNAFTILTLILVILRHPLNELVTEP